ncbi:MAG: TAXI family TRAP transporter solute-binding subunit, partial [Aeromonas sp.]
MKPVCILCALLLTVSALPAQAAEFISIATGAVTGVYYPAGGAICRLLNQRSDAPRCAVESSAGSRDNLKLLEDGK